jgi:hypothetical protein
MKFWLGIAACNLVINIILSNFQGFIGWLSAFVTGIMIISLEEREMDKK